ncbi:hypothetical protein LIER_35192 [Lithospermum erythrorhizon]|uniref:Uncharacterized protein n=1 Tax=Lithospermum erythrorhizon TaxID=34254 RepID=A0AAV3NMK8_LITER
MITKMDILTKRMADAGSALLYNSTLQVLQTIYLPINWSFLEAGIVQRCKKHAQSLRRLEIFLMMMRLATAIERP